MGRRLKVSDKLADNTFNQVSNLGVDPMLIEILQFHFASPQAVAEQQRKIVAVRSGLSQIQSRYLVSSSEQEKIRELSKRLQLTTSSTQSRIKKLEFQRRLKCRMWFNDGFQDAGGLIFQIRKLYFYIFVFPLILFYFKTIVRFNLKLVVAGFLSSPLSAPNSVLLDEAFVDALVCRGNVSMATLLLPHITQTAIDSSFAELQSIVFDGVFDIDVLMNILQLLTDGLSGFIPNSALIDELYVSLSQQSIDNEARLILSEIEPLASEEVKFRLQREAAGRNHRNVFSQNRGHLMEIHNYSATVIREGPDTLAASSSSSSPSSNQAQAAAPRRRRPGNSLNEAVLAAIRRRLPSILQPLSQDEVHERLSEILSLEEEFSPDVQERAMRYLESFLDQESSAIFGECLQYIDLIAPAGNLSVHVLWVRGFVGESVQANSCVMGAIERGVTGYMNAIIPRFVHLAFL